VLQANVEVDGQRYRDAFHLEPARYPASAPICVASSLAAWVDPLLPCGWLADPNSEIISFAKQTSKDLKLLANFVPQMLQSILMPLFSSSCPVLSYPATFLYC
jgi:hypothetical protein